MNKLPISAYIITLNEEKNIRRCLESLKEFDEIVVVDSFSKDKTVSICREYTDKIFQHEWPGHTAQYEYALARTTGDWVFWIDADEAVEPQLLESIRRVFQEGPPSNVNGYYISRLTRYLGRWIRHGAWYPDYKLRLFRKDAARYTGHDPHMKVVVTGKTDRLSGELLHYTIDNFSEHLRTLDRYSDIFAQNWLASGARFSITPMVVRPMGKFLEAYIYKRGFRDGLPGFIIAVTSAFGVFTRYVKFWEKIR